MCSCPHGGIRRRFYCSPVAFERTTDRMRRPAARSGVIRAHCTVLCDNGRVHGRHRRVRRAGGASGGQRARPPRQRPGPTRRGTRPARRPPGPARSESVGRDRPASSPSPAAGKPDSDAVHRATNPSGRTAGASGPTETPAAAHGPRSAQPPSPCRPARVPGFVGGGDIAADRVPCQPDSDASTAPEVAVTAEGSRSRRNAPRSRATAPRAGRRDSPSPQHQSPCARRSRPTTSPRRAPAAPAP
jgi:hypothetical protein